MKRLLLIVMLLMGLQLSAQDTLHVAPIADSLSDSGIGHWGPVHDTVYILHTDTLTMLRVDSVYIIRTDTIIKRVADTAALSALREKEAFYREILSANGVDKEKLEAERNYYIHMVDSLRSIVRIAEIEAVRKEEANKYLEERAKAAEERIAQTNNKKKKIRPIQGVALRFYRAPDWEIRLKSGAEDGKYDKYISNRNAGSVDFDYVTGASVMLWDLTEYFNKDHNIGNNGKGIKRFDQQFNYDLGIYVGFGGSNLFRNFYVGTSFRFVDFFYLTLGLNIAEYQVLKSGYSSGEVIGPNLSIEDVTAKAWLVKPFVSLSIDLDFLSYIKK